MDSQSKLTWSILTTPAMSDLNSAGSTVAKSTVPIRWRIFSLIAAETLSATMRATFAWEPGARLARHEMQVESASSLNGLERLMMGEAKWIPNNRTIWVNVETRKIVSKAY